MLKVEICKVGHERTFNEHLRNIVYVFACFPPDLQTLISSVNELVVKTNGSLQGTKGAERT